ncbi:MAG TPA: DUF1573 domain-containing protein [Patescibacteria group bacterium]|nr:DUF1573 domain-containing protein [Patescibacteria group bacterium]
MNSLWNSTILWRKIALILIFLLLFFQFFDVKLKTGAMNIFGVEQVYAADLYDMILCPSGCGMPISQCDMPESREAKAYVDSLVSQNLSKKEVLVALKEKYGSLVNEDPLISYKDAQSNAEGVFAIEPNSFDFGTISMKDGKVRKTFTLKNISGQTIVTRAIDTSCMCTKASLTYGGISSPFLGMTHGGGGPSPDWGVEIPKGKNAEITIEFDPAAHGKAGIGPIKRTAEIYVKSPKKIKQHIEITANVVE